MVAHLPPHHPVMVAPAIWLPSTPRSADEFAVALFRTRIEVSGKARSLWVTASQRFELFVDGQLVARGPARSDPARWGVRHLVLPAGLRAGTHSLAVRVIHFGKFAGIGQMGAEPFLLVVPERGVKLSAEGWKAYRDPSVSPVRGHVWGARSHYYAAGCGEAHDGSLHPWGWAQPGFDDAAWAAAVTVATQAFCPWGNTPLKHLLQLESIPPMEERRRAFARVALAEPAAIAATPSPEGPWTIPANTSARLVLDAGKVVVGFLELTLSGPGKADVRLVSCEAPYDAQGHKAPRDQVAGNNLWGHRDDIHHAGGDGRLYRTGWIRALRHLEVCITTGDSPLTVDDAAIRTSGFPLRDRTEIAATGDKATDWLKLHEVSLRTVRLCSHETFFDCPHFEQAQFPGDTRIQAVYHYVTAGEDRLARKAMDDFAASRLPEGLTQCRWPSRSVQMMPSYSLYWIGMLHDFLVYRGDTGFIAPYLPACDEVLNWFISRLRSDGLLGLVDYAPFMDWSPGFEKGNPPQGPDGGSTILSLLLAQALTWTCDLRQYCGLGESPRYRKLARHIVASVKTACLGPSGMLCDGPGLRTTSVHSQVEGILSGLFGKRSGAKALLAALESPKVTQVGTFYYRYYVGRAMRACGLDSHIPGLMGDWWKCLEVPGVTTWPEGSLKHSRSDCHAWSVMPGIELLETILGVRPYPGAIGYSLATLNPRLPAGLDMIAGAVATPHGPIRVRLERKAGGVHAELASPVPVWIAPLNCGVEARFSGRLRAR